MCYTVFCTDGEGKTSPVFHTQHYTDALRISYLNQKNPRIERCFIRSAGEDMEGSRMEDLISQQEVSDDREITAVGD
jgi:hypothetical protein